MAFRGKVGKRQINKNTNSSTFSLSPIHFYLCFFFIIFIFAYSPLLLLLLLLFAFAGAIVYDFWPDEFDGCCGTKTTFFFITTENGICEFFLVAVFSLVLWSSNNIVHEIFTALNVRNFWGILCGFHLIWGCFKNLFV